MPYVKKVLLLLAVFCGMSLVGFAKLGLTVQINDSCRGAELNFSYTLSGLAAGDTIDFKQWKFDGRGTNYTSGLDTVKAVTFLDGSKTKDSNYVTLIITTMKNGKRTDSVYFRRKIFIKSAPVVKFTAKNTCYDSAVSFTNTTDSFGDALSYHWKIKSTTTFAYNQYFDVKNPAPVKIPAGTFVAYLRAYDATTGCANADSISGFQAFTVQDFPVANFSGDTAVCQGVTKIYKSLSSVGYGNAPDSFVWDFGDGSPIQYIRTTDSVSHTYKGSGPYNLKLKAYTDLGCVGNKSRGITIKSTPIPNFTYLGQCQGAPVKFTNSSTVGGAGTLSYIWTFTGTDTSSSKDPSYTFANGGSYRVKLEAKASTGCFDTISKSVNIIKVNQPKVSFTEACASDTNTFKDITTPSATDTVKQRTWDFGDGTTLTTSQIFVKHKYAKSGLYTSSLTLVTQSGCTLTNTFKTGAFDVPTVDFSSNSACTFNKINFKNNSVASKGDTITKVIWDFGDTLSTSTNPNSTTSFNPTHVYIKSGIYTVKLTAISGKACSNSFTKSVTILSSPTTTFTNGAGCQNSDINFNYTGDGSSYLWNFGDTTTLSDTSISKTPIYNYKYGGIVRVRLAVKGSNGCADTSYRNIPIYKKSVPDFTVSGRCQGELLTFTSVTDSADKNPPLIGKYVWDLSTEKDSGANLDRISRGFKVFGTKSISLKVTTKEGCSSSKTKSITISQKPKADFDYTRYSCREDGVSLLNGASGNTNQWSYEYNDGSLPDSVPSPKHIFPLNADSVQITLTVKSSAGCYDTISKYVKFYKSPKALADVSPGDENMCLGQPFNANDLSTDADGNANVTRLWIMGDGSTATKKNPQYVYATFGTYNVKLVTYSSQGCKDTSKSVLITVFKPPFAVISHDTKLCSNFPVTFFADSSTDFDRDASIWTIDNNTLNGGRVNYTFTKDGSYQIRLIAKNNVPGYNCADTDSVTINILPSPTPLFTAPAVCFGLPTTFTNTTADTVGKHIKFNWSFGDDIGGTSDSASPTYQYFSAGTYLVKLFASADYGAFKCKALYPDSVQITVNANPKAAFSMNPNPMDNLIAESTPIDSSSSDVTKWTWLYGDGDTTTGPIPATHKYPTVPYDTGTFIAKLFVENQFGCKDSAFQIVKLKQYLVPFIPNSFTPNGDGLNDYWKPVAKGVLTYRVTILDRWGEEVYYSEDYNEKGWDGTYRKTGDKVPEGMYMYSIEATDYDNLEIRKYKGTIVIIQ